MTSTPNLFNSMIALNQLNLTNIRADLTGARLDALPNLPDLVFAGETVTVEFDIQNIGTAPSGPSNVNFYLSVDNIIDPASDRLLGTTALPIISTNPFSSVATFTLPEITDPFWNGSGDYFLGMVIDPGNAVVENNEANNANVGLAQDFDTLSVVVDDAYEENDGPATAFDLTSQENVRLSNLSGLGFQADADWYAIRLDPGFENLVATLEFVHANGDLNLFVFDAAGTLITSANSVTDNETIDTVLPAAGTYFLAVNGVSGIPTANTYDLVWDDVLVDDAYEINNSISEAFDLTAQKNVPLSQFNGLGRQNDQDWYEIAVESGFENLVASLTFSQAAGNLDLFVFDEVGSLVAESVSITDNELIDVNLPSAGTYFLLVNDVDDAATFNSYDLVWNTLLLDDAYEDNDTLATAFDLSAQRATRLSTISGRGVQADQDWYQIQVAPGFENLIADLEFIHANGDLQLRVFDAAGTLVTESTSDTDNEAIDFILPSAGTYYLQIDSAMGDATANAYDLIWNNLRFIEGTEARDVLIGTAGRDTILGRRGDDDLIGLGGNDRLGGDRGDDDLFGSQGNDFLDGGRGDDVLTGVNPLVSAAGSREADVLIGGRGDDVFVLGDSTQVYYDDGFASTPGITSFALIQDFQPGRDVIQLRGEPANYQLSSDLTNVPEGIGILLNVPGQAELIAVVQGTEVLTLDSDDFVYV
ncbi:MAG: pre-peptidase C-terminal domain-containing protein [Elainellaceae cyanobacterium]